MWGHPLIVCKAVWGLLVALALLPSVALVLTVVTTTVVGFLVVVVVVVVVLLVVAEN